MESLLEALKRYVPDDTPFHAEFSLLPKTENRMCMKSVSVTLGNVEILKREKVAFLSSRRVPPDVVMKSYDWAAHARDAGTCVIGGFQSALERDVLKILLKGTQPTSANANRPSSPRSILQVRSADS